MIAGSPERAPLLALGLGNLLLGDDAVGLRLAAELCSGDLNDSNDLEIQDGGTQGIALLGWIERRETVIVLDAVSLGDAAGTVHVLRGGDLARLRARRAQSAHEGNALELLETARLLGDAPREIVCIGVEPKNVRTGIGLSAEVEAALPEALRRIREILEELRQRRSPHVSGDSGPDSGSERD